MTTRASEKALAAQAAFIFKGTVRKLKAATMRSVEVTDQTLIVRVDRVIQGPKALAAYLDQEITVQLSEGGKLKKGEQAIFYTNGWLFGESVAVQSIGHTKVEDKATPRSLSSAPELVQPTLDQKLSQHVAEADVVLKGRVTSIRMPGESAKRKGSMSTAATGPISEHNAHWREALIEVEDVQKGEHAHQQLIVRFPSSRDIAWANSPKFEPGQEGIFILHKDKDEPPQRGAKATREVYTALHPEDFQPLHKAREIRTIIQQSAPKKKTPSTKKRR
jgi:hypothetical protein